MFYCRVCESDVVCDEPPCVVVSLRVEDSEVKPGEMPGGWRSPGGLFKLPYTHPLCDNSLAVVVGVMNLMGPLLVLNGELEHDSRSWTPRSAARRRRSPGGLFKLPYTHPLCDNSLAVVVGVVMGPLLVLNGELEHDSRSWTPIGSSRQLDLTQLRRPLTLRS